VTSYAASLRVKLNSLVAVAAALALIGVLTPPEAIAQVGGANVGGVVTDGASGQTDTTGTVTGTIVDSSGTPLPGVAVSLKSPQAGRDFTAVTDGQGSYRVTSLPPNTYELRAELSGFQSVLRQVTVGPSAVTEVNVTLVVGVTEYVEVTARKRAEDLQKVPVSIAADTADELQAQSIQRLSDLGQLTPNLLYGQKVQSGNSAGQIYLRGIGQQDTKVTFSAGVALYVDGVYLGRAQANDLDMADVERVEVLYGPQGTLFGKNSNGGAINIVTSRPDYLATGPSGTLEVQAGDYGRIDARGMLNLPLATSKATLRVSAAVWHQDGYSVRVDGQDQANQNRFVGRLQFSLKPKDSLEALLRVDGTAFHEHSAAHRLVDVRETSGVPVLYATLTPYRYDDRWVTGSDFQSNGTGPNTNAGNVWGTSLTLNWTRRWGTLQSISAFRKLHVDTEFDPDVSPLTVLDIIDPYDQHQASQEFTAIGTALGGKLNWVGGLYYFRERAQDLEGAILALEVFHGAANLSYNNYVLNRSYAAYGQATYGLTDKLRLTAGGRLGDDLVDASREQTGYPDRSESQQPLVSRSAGWVSFLPRVGLDYQWTPDLMIYVSAAKGSKSGGFNGRAASIAEYTRFEPEKVWAYELGLRSEWFSKRLRFNATGFYSDYRDFQIQLNTSTTDPETGRPHAFSFVGNVPKASVTGGELVLAAAPLPDLRLSAGVGVTDGKYLEVIPGAPVTTDSDFVNAPKVTFAVSSEYSRSLGKAGQVSGRVDYIHKSTIQYDYGNSPLVEQAPYGLLNARLTWQPRDSRLSVFLFGTNLTNSHYALGGIDDGPTGGLGEVIKLMGAPRAWGLGTHVRF